MNFDNSNIELEEMCAGVKRKILAHGGKLMTVEVHTEKGAVVPTHSHVHEQIGYIITGLYEGIVEGKKSILKPGDSYYAKSNQEHGLICLEEGKCLDIFTPQREDFK